MNKKIAIISIFTLLIDQLVKIFISNTQIYKEIIPNFLSITYAENTGIAFSMMSNSRFLIILISIILLIFIFYVIKKDYQKLKSNLPIIAFGLLIGGIIGNLIDRVIRGYVIDYISLNIFGYKFPVFNIADLAITIGIALVIIMEFNKDKKVNV